MAAADQFRKRAVEQPHPVDRVAPEARSLQLRPCVTEEVRQRPETVPARSSDPRPEPGGKCWTQPAGRDRYRHRPVSVDRWKNERGVLEVVGAVGPDARALGVRVHCAVDLGDPGGRDDQTKP